MKFNYYSLETCHEAKGLVVVVDVIRAFTTSAVALARGAREILPVGTVEEALEYKRNHPGALAFGEVGGIPPQGFDFGNSPTHTDALDLQGRTIVQRTSAGTQGIVRSRMAQHLVAASFVVAKATVKYIQALQALHNYEIPNQSNAPILPLLRLLCLHAINQKFCLRILHIFRMKQKKLQPGFCLHYLFPHME